MSRLYAIIQGKKEVERVLYRDEDTNEGFLIVPDLKWDQTSMNALVSCCPLILGSASPPVVD